MFRKFLAAHSFSEYRFGKDLFPTLGDRVFWEHFQNDTCVHDAEAALDYRWPVILATDFMAFKENADRRIMERPHFDRRDHLVLFTLAELKENKGRFLPQIVNGLFAICEESYWGLSAHWYAEVGNIPTPAEPYIDLFAAETAEHLSMICHLLEKPLAAFCPEILDRVSCELERRIKVPYLTHSDYIWMGQVKKRVNNWNPWILSNLLTVFLLTEQDPCRLHQALEKMFTELQCYYDGIPGDGGCDEGPDYWGQAGGSLFEFICQLKEATGGELDLFGDKKLGRIAAYLKKVHITDDLFCNVADAHAEGKSDMMPLLFAFARETKQEDLADFAAAVYAANGERGEGLHHTIRTLRRLIYQSRVLHEMATYASTHPLHGAVEYLPDLQIAALRAGTLTLHAKGGHNREHHNHNDVGSFTLYDGSTPLLVDVGINTYTGLHFNRETRYVAIPWVRSPYHNLPIVNGQEQQYGSEFRGDAFAVREGEITVSFAGAYLPEAGLEKLTRTLLLTENGLCLTDAFSFADGANRAVTEVLMSVLPVDAEADRVILGQRYGLRAEGGRIRTEFIPFTDPLLERDWGCTGVTRILLDFENTEKVCIEVTKL